MASSPSGSDNNTNNPTGPNFYYDQSAKFNPTTAVVIISLIGGCFVLAFLSILLRKCIRGGNDAGRRGGPQYGGATTQSGSYQSKSKGLEKADVDALPLVHREDLGEKDERECPVCLTEFEAEDTLRLLPTCKHVFHRECIDAWFDAHSTCPLCRASLLSQPVAEVKIPEPRVAPGHGEPGDTVTEVSGSGDSDPHPASDVQRLDDSQTAAAAPPSGALISREDSAHGTLFRNSESFKRAAAVTTTSEQQPVKDSSFRKPPAGPSSSIRRSSALGADLISLRNLLMRQNDQNRVNASPSGSSRWFTRARSLEVVAPREYSREEWVTIDLETGKAAAINAELVPSSSSSRPERAWSERWSLAGLKGAVIFPLSRSTSDVSSRSAHLPV